MRNCRMAVAKGTLQWERCNENNGNGVEDHRGSARAASRDGGHRLEQTAWILTDVEELVRFRQPGVKLGSRKRNVLVHLLVDRGLAGLRGVRGLQERHLWRQQPSQHEPKQRVVPIPAYVGVNGRGPPRKGPRVCVNNKTTPTAHNPRVRPRQHSDLSDKQRRVEGPLVAEGTECGRYAAPFGEVGSQTRCQMAPLMLKKEPRIAWGACPLTG